MHRMYPKGNNATGTNCLGDEEVLLDEQLFGAEQTTGGWGEQQADDPADSAALHANEAADTESDRDSATEDAAAIAEGGEVDAWQEATQIVSEEEDSDIQDDSDASVVHGAGELDENAEWRQVARAEMLEEHYRGARVCVFIEHVAWSLIIRHVLLGPSHFAALGQEPVISSVGSALL